MLNISFVGGERQEMLTVRKTLESDRLNSPDLRMSKDSVSSVP